MPTHARLAAHDGWVTYGFGLLTSARNPAAHAESGEAVHKLCTDRGGLSVGSEAHALRAVSSGSAWCGRSPANPPQPLGNMSIERAIALSILSSKVRRGCALFLVGEAASRRVGKSMSWILTLPGSM
jgi:hypothetical protein